MRLKEKKILQKFDAILKKFSAQGAKKVDYGSLHLNKNIVTRLKWRQNKHYPLQSD